MPKINNKIYVFITDDNAILKYPKFNIVTKAYIGRNGAISQIQKQEGDGKTPLGEFELGIALGKFPSTNNTNGLKYMQITEDMYWIDDVKSKYYNQLVNISKVTKDWNSAEHLIDYPIQYEYLIEIKTNPNNIPQRGSAIFLHCSNNQATAGCVAVDRNVMKEIIENIDENTKIIITKM